MKSSASTYFKLQKPDGVGKLVIMRLVSAPHQESKLLV